MATKTRLLIVAGSVAMLAAAQGCSMLGNRPGGRGMSEDRYTYVSTPNMAQTVALRNTWTGEVIWTVEVPVGQQLVVRFVDSSSKTEAQGWDLMRWSLMSLGSNTNNLENQIVVPPASGRRLEGSIRKGPELASAAWAGGYGAGGYVPPQPPEPPQPKAEKKPTPTPPPAAAQPTQPAAPALSVPAPKPVEPAKPADEPPVELPQ